MSKNSPGWAVQLLGHQFDLDDSYEQLQKPFDPWSEMYSTNEERWHLLRSLNWDKLAEASEVRHDAGRLVKQINGAALLMQIDAEPLQVGQVIYFDMDGNRIPVLFAVSGQMHMSLGRIRMRGHFSSPSAGSPAPPQASDMQLWLKSAEVDDAHADLLGHLSRADNWYDLYKAAELARRIAGGSRGLASALGADKKEWDRVWQTANCYRHAPDPSKYPLPKQPPSLEEARNIMFKAIRRVL